MLRKNNQIALAVITVSMFFNLCLLTGIAIAINKSQAQTMKLLRAKEILRYKIEIVSKASDLAGAQLMMSMRSPGAQKQFDYLLNRIPQELQELKEVVGDSNPHQAAAVQTLEKIIPQTLSMFKESSDQISTQRGRLHGMSFYANVRQNSEQMRQEFDELTKDDKELYEAKLPKENSIPDTIRLILLVGVVGNILSAVLIAVFVDRVIREAAAHAKGNPLA